jgi:hypothetical protein
MGLAPPQACLGNSKEEKEKSAVTLELPGAYRATAEAATVSRKQMEKCRNAGNFLIWQIWLEAC